MMERSESWGSFVELEALTFLLFISLWWNLTLSSGSTHGGNPLPNGHCPNRTKGRSTLSLLLLQSLLSTSLLLLPLNHSLWIGCSYPLSFYRPCHLDCLPIPAPRLSVYLRQWGTTAMFLPRVPWPSMYFKIISWPSASPAASIVCLNQHLINSLPVQAHSPPACTSTVYQHSYTNCVPRTALWLPTY